MNIIGEGIGSLVAEKMFAEPQFGKAEFVGQERFFRILGQCFGKRAGRRMHRHHEKSEPHSPPICRRRGRS
jgi:hypothetical protein